MPALFLLLVLFSTPCAADIVVSPVRLLMTYGKDTTTVNLTNNTEKMILFQVEPFLWTQDEGDDKLNATKEIIAMPPIFTLEPGKTQMIRIALRRPRAEKQEITYRIFITQVPDETVRASQGIHTNLRISVPIFVRPKGSAKPQIDWQVRKIGDSQLKLMVKNTGNAHILLGTVQLFPDKGSEEPFYENAISGYVLGGQSRSWTLNLKQSLQLQDIILRVETDDGKKETRLAVQYP